MPSRPRAFTLIELLVVVAIIALLISILIPSLGKARAIARATKCGAGLHAVGQAVAGYQTENDNVFPASYLYPTNGSPDPVDPSNQASAPAFGYQHWSYYLFNQVKDLTAFTCPEFEKGGIPRSNPGPNPAYWMSGQVDQLPSSVPTATSLEDKQAPFMAFTANAALIPRNKFTANLVTSDPTESGDGSRVNVFVKRTSLTCAESSTILLTEFNTNWKTIATASGNQFFARGHRPVNPFFNLGSGTQVYANTSFFTNLSPSSLDDVNGLINAANTSSSLITDANNILNAVGRNHPGSTSANGISYGGTSNFLYVDGHTERKNVYDTLKNKEWGDRFYSVNGDNSVR